MLTPTGTAELIDGFILYLAHSFAG